MKKNFFALAGYFLIVFSNPAATACLQLSEQFDHYVVIGAFANKNNALQFTNFAQKENLPAKFEFNPGRNLYYVYVLNTDNLPQAINEALNLRVHTTYSDTWVYHGYFGKESRTVSSFGTDIHPATEDKIIQVEPNDNALSSSEQTPFTAEDPVITAVNTALPVRPVGEKRKTNVNGAKEGKNFFFKIYRAVDQRDVTGEVDIIDMDKTKKIGAYQGNSPVLVSMPSNKSGDVSAVCELFGYRKTLHTFNYNNPEGEGINIDEQGNIVVPFELVRLQKGDIAVMYNVYFFKDAGVMRPESKYEVNNLLDMLKENPNYIIRIHGHTNGGSHGKIISMSDDENKNFFSLTGTKDSFGSAKKLSYERAKVIEAYLVSNGVAAERMSIKAWGGKRPIHEKHHARAAENVRVEVEIVED